MIVYWNVMWCSVAQSGAIVAQFGVNVAQCGGILNLFLINFYKSIFYSKIIFQVFWLQ